MSVKEHTIAGPLSWILQETGFEVRLNKHVNRKNTLVVAAMYAMYEQGASLAKVGEAFGKTRQCVYDIFRARGYELRSKPMKHLTMIDGIRWTWHSKGGMRGTLPGGRRILLHQYVWEKAHGPIPAGYQLHFRNGDKRDVRIENLELLTIPEINRRFNPHNNQFTYRRV